MSYASADSRSHERRSGFYLSAALACAVAIFVGFAPTFFLKPLFGAPNLPLLVQIHGGVFTGWILLLLAQAHLVRSGRTSTHRRLGMIGVGLALLMVVLGVMTAIEAARRGVAAAGMGPLEFLAIPLAAIALFAAFIALAFLNRSRPEYHKRLVLLATFSILTPALARLWFVHQRPPIAFALTMVFVLAAIAYDVWTRRSIHPVYLWGGLVLLASGPLRLAVAHSDAWLAVARAIVR